MSYSLTPETAERFASIALGHVTREYPHKLDQVLEGPEDLLSPRALHPIFFGSFDWHSCVHGHWLLLRTLRLHPAMPSSVRIRTLADEMLVPDKVAGELAYLDRAYTGTFERPYGWAWLLMLHREAQRHEAAWADALAPLAEAFADRFRTYLPKLNYPVRSGAHYNSAFAMVLALDWAAANDPALAALLAERAAVYYGGDRACPGWEPAGEDFLSSALTEALLLKRVLPRGEFASWFSLFLPNLAAGEPKSLFTPAVASDRSDGKLAHLDGVNLSRAWCWRGLADALPEDLAALARDAADRHLEASLPHVAGDYMGEHWLATFALLALESGSAE